MSVSLFRIFVNTLKKTLPRHPLKSGIQIRLVTAMDAVKIANNDSEDVVSNKNFTRYKRRRFMKRPWEDGSNRKENGESDEKRICDKPFERIKKKKVALLLGYSGVDYFGMQRNPGVKTIEEDLFKALLEAKYVTEDDFENQQNTQFQRSSRTDKGVSAARQVVSLKLPLEVNVDEINKGLPDCIRVFGLRRVTNKFNSKCKCDARTYSYTLPTFAFEPSLVTDEERSQYRITPEKLEQVNKILSEYIGTKCYHNFTQKKHFQDPSSSRYMMGFSVDKVFVDSNMEFAVLLVKGQSFMLHQIRKMVGLCVALARGHAAPALLARALSRDRVMVPTAPGLGLVLDMVHYTRYDAKHKESHDSLTWEKEEEAVQKFKHAYIYPSIIKGEVEGKSMATWLEKLETHSYEPSEDGPDKTLEDGDDVGGDDDDDGDDVMKDDDEMKDKTDAKPQTKDVTNVETTKMTESKEEISNQEIVSSEEVKETSDGASDVKSKEVV